MSDARAESVPDRAAHESIPVERLEEIVEGLKFEAPDRVLRIGSREEDQRRTLEDRRLENRKPGFAAELNVEIEHGRSMFRDRGAGARDAVGFGEHRKVRQFREQALELGARRRFVLHDEDSVAHALTTGNASDTRVAPAVTAAI